MVTTVQRGANAVSNKVKSLPSTTVPLEPLEQSEARFKLNQILQTTLELDQVVALFFDHVKTLVKLTGLTYCNSANKVEIHYGTEGVHSADYRLLTAQDNLGELIFTSNKRIPEAGLAQLESLIGALIYPLRNALQYRQALQTALRDPLTGAGNRAALDNALHREVQLAERYEHPLSLLVIDIDHFKAINDNYGHSSGDIVIREVANTISNTIRSTDALFRYGGEEFVVLLSNTPAFGASVIAKRIRGIIESLEIATDNDTITTSVSIGTSTLIEKSTIKGFFDSADRALYQAKQLGRNRVISSEELEGYSDQVSAEA